MQHNTQVPVGKHNKRQHASPHHEVATDVKQMPIRPIIIIIIIIVIIIIIIITWTSVDQYLRRHIASLGHNGLSRHEWWV